MKKWKFFVCVSDEQGGFNAELKYFDLKAALKCLCDFIDMGCDEAQLSDEKGVLIDYVK